MSLQIVSLVEIVEQLPRISVSATNIPMQENVLECYIYKNI